MTTPINNSNVESASKMLHKIDSQIDKINKDGIVTAEEEAKLNNLNRASLAAVANLTPEERQQLESLEKTYANLEKTYDKIISGD